MPFDLIQDDFAKSSMDDVITVEINGYKDKILQSLYHLQQRGVNCDITFQAFDGFVHLHSIILEASSNLYGNNEYKRLYNEFGHVDCRKFNIQVVIAVVKYLYTGEIIINQEHIGALAKLCDEMGLTVAFNTLRQKYPALSKSEFYLTNLPSYYRQLNGRFLNFQNNVHNFQLSEQRNKICSNYTLVGTSNSLPFGLDLEFQNSSKPYCSTSDNLTQNEKNCKSYEHMDNSGGLLESSEYQNVRNKLSNQNDASEENKILDTPGDICQTESYIDPDMFIVNLDKSESLNLKGNVQEAQKVSFDSNKQETCNGVEECTAEDVSSALNTNIKNCVLDRKSSDSSSQESNIDNENYQIKKRKVEILVESRSEEHSGMIETTADLSEKTGFGFISEFPDGYSQVAKNVKSKQDLTGRLSRKSTEILLRNRKEEQIGQVLDSLSENNIRNTRSSKKLFKKCITNRKRKVAKGNTVARTQCERNVKKGAKNSRRNGKTKRKCVKCNMEFDKYTEHAKHMREIHRPFPCELCDWVGHKRHLYASHMYGQHKIVIYPDRYPLVECEVEGCSFKCLSINKHDHSRCHQYKTDNLVCDVCGTKFVSTSGLRNHMEIHKEEEMRYPCKKCGKVFGSRYQVQRHENCEHATYKLCHQCPYKTKSQHTLTVHLHHKHGEPLPSNKKIYKCDFCDFYCFYPSYLKIHVEENHSDTSSYKCPICSKILKSRKSFRSHNLVTHGTQKHQCSQCDYTTTSKTTLKMHQDSSHSEARPFSCHLCQYRCKLKGNLNIHLRNKHKIEIITSFKLHEKMVKSGKGFEEYLNVRRKELSAGRSLDLEFETQPIGNQDSEPVSGNHVCSAVSAQKSSTIMF